VSLLIAAALCVFPAFAAGSAARIPFGAVVATDLDGDRQPDFATAGAMRREGSGYLLDISVRLSAVESGIITVRTPRAAGRLSARDLDGDADRDLILESFDREPLAIVLNDGGGHFHQVDVADYRARLGKSDPQSFDRPSGNQDSPETGESSTTPVDTPLPAVSSIDAARTARLPLGDDGFAARRFSTRASRAPPALL